MKAQLAALILAAAFMQAPAVSHAQDAEMGLGPRLEWTTLGHGTYGLYGHDIVVTPEGGKYVVISRGERDKGYESLSDAKMRAEYLASMKSSIKDKPAMKEKPMKEKQMMKEKPMKRMPLPIDDTEKGE